jgi:hypothetical protein
VKDSLTVRYAGRPLGRTEKQNAIRAHRTDVAVTRLVVRNRRAQRISETVAAPTDRTLWGELLRRYGIG